MGTFTDAGRAWSAHHQHMPSSLLTRVVARVRHRRAKSLRDLTVADHRRIEWTMRKTLEQLTGERKT